MDKPSETRAEEIARLQREIGERQCRLQRLVLGDPTRSVCGSIAPALITVPWYVETPVRSHSLPQRSPP